MSHELTFCKLKPDSIGFLQCGTELEQVGTLFLHQVVRSRRPSVKTNEWTSSLMVKETSKLQMSQIVNTCISTLKTMAVHIWWSNS